MCVAEKIWYGCVNFVKWGFTIVKLTFHYSPVCQSHDPFFVNHVSLSSTCHGVDMLHVRSWLLWGPIGGEGQIRISCRQNPLQILDQSLNKTTRVLHLTSCRWEGFVKCVYSGRECWPVFVSDYDYTCWIYTTAPTQSCRGLIVEELGGHSWVLINIIHASFLQYKVVGQYSEIDVHKPKTTPNINNTHCTL